MAIERKVKVETIITYDGTNGTQVLNALNGPNGGASTIGSDDGTTLVVIENDSEGVPTGNITATFEHGDGWNVSSNTYWSGSQPKSNWLNVSEKVVLTSQD